MLWNVLETVVELFLGLWLAIFIHELGHLFVGWLNGWRFEFLAAGPLYFARADRCGGIRFSINQNRALWGGMTNMTDPTPDVNVKHWIAYMAGGPAFSVLSAIIMLMLGIYHPPMLSFAGMYAFLSLFLSVFTALPLPDTVTGHSSDGRRIWRLTGAKNAKRGEMAAIQISKYQSGALKMTPETLAGYYRDLTLSETPLYEVIGHIGLLKHARNIHNEAEVAVHMDFLRNFTESLPEDLKSPLVDMITSIVKEDEGLPLQ